MKSLSVELGVILIGPSIFGYAEVCNAQNWVLRDDMACIDVASMHGVFEKWDIVGGFPSFEKCLKAKELRCKEFAFVHREKKNYSNNCPDSIQFVTDSPIAKGKEATLQWQFKCLPETIDPRK